jgi:hypothetical protein
LLFSTPTAKHESGVGQEMLTAELSPLGDVCRFHVLPSVVFAIPTPPTALHSTVVTQEIDTGGKEGSSIAHVEPPSVDLMIPEPPPA